MKIYITIGTNTTVIDKARDEKTAKLKIERFMREDRYEIETEKYEMPKAWGGKYPVYSYGK